MVTTDVNSQPNVMTVRVREDGHWYIGNGRSMANGPYRRPEHLIDVVSDLMGDNTNWRIEVLNANDKLIAAYDGCDLQSGAFSHSRRQNTWPEVN